MQFVDREVGSALDQPIGGMLKITLNDELDHAVKGLASDGAGVEKRWLAIHGREAGGMNIDPIVIGPHQGKFETSAVGRSQKALLEATLQERPIVIVVPIKDKDVNAM